MKLVAETSEADLAKNRALQDLDFPLTQLAANLLRVTRGAGRPYELPRQMVAVLEALQDYREAAGVMPTTDEWHDVISLRARERRTDEIDAAIETMVQGALQMAASQLAGQKTQEAAGERELLDGCDQLELARKRIRDEMNRPQRSRKR